MRQDVRKVDGKDFPSQTSPSELGATQSGWFNRLKDFFTQGNWVGCGMSLLTHHASGSGSIGKGLAGDRIGSDGASTGASEGASKGAVHAGMTNLSDKHSNRPTRKEAPMSTDSKQRSSQKKLRVHIRWMIRRDMAEVLDIERESFEFPWYEEDFIRCLRQRNCIGMVAEHGERVVGFMIYELHKTRLHILNFAVAESFRGRDVGRQMADKLISKLSSQRRTRITLEVRETNLPAQLFFKQLGFRATSVLRSYYDDSPEDAYLMQYRYVPDEREATIPIHGANRIDRLAG